MKLDRNIKMAVSLLLPTASIFVRADTRYEITLDVWHVGVKLGGVVLSACSSLRRGKS